MCACACVCVCPCVKVCLTKQKWLKKKSYTRGKWKANMTWLCCVASWVKLLKKMKTRLKKKIELFSAKLISIKQMSIEFSWHGSDLVYQYVWIIFFLSNQKQILFLMLQNHILSCFFLLLIPLMVEIEVMLSIRIIMVIRMIRIMNNDMCAHVI